MTKRRIPQRKRRSILTLGRDGLVFPISIVLSLVTLGVLGAILAQDASTQADTNEVDTDLAIILCVVAAILVCGAGLSGFLATRRFVQPLRAATQAAQSIAAGGISTRLPATIDPVLSPLTDSFNEMANTLARRVENDARFNSNVSHELRSPLTTLNASVAVLQGRRADLSEQNQLALDLLSGDLLRFTRLVDDLLEISRFDSGTASLTLNSVNIAEFLTEVVNTTHHESLQFVVSPMLKILEMDIDRRRMARVITNLIDNALEHGSGYVTLSGIEIPPGDAGPTHVRLVVEDRGDGVDLDNSELLFERFNRGNRTLQNRSRSGTRRTAGSGLGLALAREHVSLHHGTIQFEPPPVGFSGARVVVTLPLRTPHSQFDNLDNDSF